MRPDGFAAHLVIALARNSEPFVPTVAAPPRTGFAARLLDALARRPTVDAWAVAGPVTLRDDSPTEADARVNVLGEQALADLMNYTVNLSNWSGVRRINQRANLRTLARMVTVAKVLGNTYRLAVKTREQTGARRFFRRVEYDKSLLEFRQAFNLAERYVYGFSSLQHIIRECNDVLWLLQTSLRGPLARPDARWLALNSIESFAFTGTIKALDAALRVAIILVQGSELSYAAVDSAAGPIMHEPDTSGRGVVQLPDTAILVTLQRILLRSTNDFAGADLRDAQLDGVDLRGVTWSRSTQWPPRWQAIIEHDSIPRSNGLYEIQPGGPGGSNPDRSALQPHR